MGLVLSGFLLITAFVRAQHAEIMPVVLFHHLTKDMPISAISFCRRAYQRFNHEREPLERGSGVGAGLRQTRPYGGGLCMGRGGTGRSY